MTGLLKAILYVKTSSPQTDITVKLVDVHENGDAYNVTDGVLRRAYSALNEPHKIGIDLFPTSMLFFKGHKIRIEVSSSNFPKINRNMNTSEPFETAVKGVVAQQTLYHSLEYPSHILLPIIKQSNKSPTSCNFHATNG